VASDVSGSGGEGNANDGEVEFEGNHVPSSTERDSDYEEGSDGSTSDSEGNCTGADERVVAGKPINMVYLVVLYALIQMKTYACKIGKGRMYPENNNSHSQAFKRYYGGATMKHFVMVERNDGVTAFHVETLLHNIFKKYRLNSGELFSLHVSHFSNAKAYVIYFIHFYFVE
jgi:hypothetical protein